MQVLWQVDTILFSLLIQGGLCDSQGRVWRNDPSQLYAVEVTLPEVYTRNLTKNLLKQQLNVLFFVEILRSREAAYSRCLHSSCVGHVAYSHLCQA